MVTEFEEKARQIFRLIRRYDEGKIFVNPATGKYEPRAELRARHPGKGFDPETGMPAIVHEPSQDPSTYELELAKQVSGLEERPWAYCPRKLSNDWLLFRLLEKDGTAFAARPIRKAVWQTVSVRRY